MTNEIKIDLIRIDGGTQPRASINESLVADYAEHVSELPPLSVFFDGKDYWLADGFHRYHAHRRAGSKTVAINVHKGTQRDAILYSVGANATHGLRRSNEDKRNAVETLLKDAEWVKWPQSKIAETCCVSREFVNRVAADIEPASCDRSQDSDRTVTRNGKTYQQNVTNIGAKKKTPPAPTADDHPEYAGGDVPDDNELAYIAEVDRLERETLERLIVADDKLVALRAEVNRLTKALAVMTGSRNQWQNQCAELKRRLAAAKRNAA